MDLSKGTIPDDIDQFEMGAFNLRAQREERLVVSGSSYLAWLLDTFSILSKFPFFNLLHFHHKLREGPKHVRTRVLSACDSHVRKEG